MARSRRSTCRPGSGEINYDPTERVEKRNRLIVISNVFDILFISYARFFFWQLLTERVNKHYISSLLASFAR